MDYTNFFKNRLNGLNKINEVNIDNYFENNTNNKKEFNKDFRKRILKISLVGNPNTGKTTLFNRLTGSAQYVGNWPGITVEKKEGKLKNSKIPTKIIDLPGVYSLSPYSPEEIVTRNFLLNNNYDIILNILDSTNLERNLYLTTQLMELDTPILIALNMCDLLKSKGKIIDFCKLENKLGVPVVMISANKKIGIDNLKEKIFTLYNFSTKLKKNNNFYNEEVEKKISKISKILDVNMKSINNKRFIITKILEDDILINLHLKANLEVYKKIDEVKKTAIISSEEILGLRYNFSTSVSLEVVQDIKKINKTKFSRKIDKVITGKYTALPIFFIIIFLIFYITFGPIGSFFEKIINIFLKDGLINIVNIFLNQIKASVQIKSLVLNAIIAGIFEIMIFVPQMIILFGLLAFLEDTGYMARAAFIMDRILRWLGLSGKAFVPLLMGFGCNVPAILGTRILENKKEKNLSIFFIPFLSCGSKTPIYLLFFSVFFPNNKAFFIFLVYLFGIILGILTLLLFKNTILKDDDLPFIMELPDYKIPSVRNLLNYILECLKNFLEKAGTIILGSTILIWFLQSYNVNLNYTLDPSKSILSKIGNLLAPIFIPCGFGNWKACVSLITGILSKEAIVSTMAVIYRTGSDMPLRMILKNHFNTASMFSFVAFVLLYLPCIAAISAIKREIKSNKLTVFIIIFQSSVAWIVSMIIYQFGCLFLK